MTFFRKRLGAWAIGWLLCQALALAVLLPPDCCAAHHAKATGEKECHQPTTAGEQCPMVSDDGQPCPMHQTQTAGTEQADRTCRMRGICQGPSLAIGALFSLPGVLAEPLSALVPAPHTAVVPVSFRVPVVSLAFETPPPRA